MVSKSNDKQRGDQRFSLAELEQLTTHQMAELLANCVLLLRRLPDVRLSELAQIPTEPEQQASNTGGDDLVNRAHNRVNGQSQPKWWAGREQ